MRQGKKFTFNEVNDYLNKYNYKVLDNQYEGVDNKLNIEDIEGYKYFISMHQFYCGVHNKGNIYKPDRFAIQNPYTIENIKHWLYFNNKTFTFSHGEYKNNNTKSLYFTCNKCNETWNDQWDVIQSGCACPYCAGKRISFSNSLAKARPDLVLEWNYERNGNLIPESVAPHSKKIVWWKCLKCEYEWKTNINNRNALTEEKSTNCPRCKQSLGEKRIEEWLINKNIKYNAEYIIYECRYKRPLPFDFYLENLNCCIEYQGEQHYKPKDFNSQGKIIAEQNFIEQKIKDEIKVNFCKNNNILLIVIPYWNYKNIEVILSQILESLYKDSINY
jgi:DNA-directed RNA polymerase subunit RPC12/RpoP